MKFLVFDKQTCEYRASAEFLLNSEGILFHCKGLFSWEYEPVEKDRYIVEYLTGDTDKNNNFVHSGHFVKFPETGEEFLVRFGKDVSIFREYGVVHKEYLFYLEDKNGKYAYAPDKEIFKNFEIVGDVNKDGVKW